MVNSRGSSTSVKTYNLTGTATNAHSSSHKFTGMNIANDVIVVGSGKGLITRFQDFSPIYTKLAFSDTRMTNATSLIKLTSATINVNSTSSFPSTGRVLIKNARLKEGAAAWGKAGHTIQFNYTSKTATSLTGLPDMKETFFPYYIDEDSPVLLQDVIIVDDTSSFPASGHIMIGNEIIAYSAKASSTTFTVSSATNYKRNVSDISTLNGAVTSTATSIVLDDASAFPASGKVLIYSPTNIEYVSYTGISTNILTGVTRGIDGTSAISHQSGETVHVVDNPASSKYTGIHPKGVLVYNYVTTGIPEANSSIALKGRYTRTIRSERAQTIEDLEAYASRYLEKQRWGDQMASIVDPVAFDYDAVLVGDKTTNNDTSLGWSSFETRVLSKILNINRRGSYSMNLDIATYSDNPIEASLAPNERDSILQMSGSKDSTVENSGTDNRDRKSVV